MLVFSIWTRSILEVLRFFTYNVPFSRSKGMADAFGVLMLTLQTSLILEKMSMKMSTIVLDWSIQDVQQERNKTPADSYKKFGHLLTRNYTSDWATITSQYTNTVSGIIALLYCAAPYSPCLLYLTERFINVCSKVFHLFLEQQFLENTQDTWIRHSSPPI